VEGREYDPHIALMELIVDSALWVFNVVFALVAVYAGFRLLFFAPDSGAVEQLKKMLTYAVAGAIVVNLSYAIVNATQLLFT
jgi:predicted anti-sigma-YlaC factor YlaD